MGRERLQLASKPGTEKIQALQPGLKVLAQLAKDVRSNLKPLAVSTSDLGEPLENPLRYLQIRETEGVNRGLYIANVLFISFGNRRHLALRHNKDLGLHRAVEWQLERFKPVDSETYERTRLTERPALGSNPSLELEVTKRHYAEEQDRNDPHENTLCDSSNDYMKAEHHIRAFECDLGAALLLFASKDDEPAVSLAAAA